MILEILTIRNGNSKIKRTIKPKVINPIDSIMSNVKGNTIRNRVNEITI
ncbi:hypothetical protein [Helicobacter sp. MIT 14-3879]|nr:hypothetical protein [Helicobacter sp. MIT 14-3879]